MADSKETFAGGCRPTLIGSLPLSDHDEAARLILAHAPEIPLWAQLPTYPGEGMIAQFLPGMPGLVQTGERQYLDTSSETFEAEYLAFFEEYLAVAEGRAELDTSRFAFTPETAPGFFTLIEHLADPPPEFYAVKGQVTGSFTLATSVKDQTGRDAFYDDRLRDAAVKLTAMKARWQARELGKLHVPVLIFLDEPALAGFGASAYLGVSREDVFACLAEPMEALAEEGALSGVHVCANTDWSLVLDSAADVVSFDAFAFFEKFILYNKAIVRFLQRGGIIAWGIVPTLDKEAIQKADADSLCALFLRQFEALCAAGIDRETLFRQSLITPACGTGSLDVALAKKVLALNQEVSARIRKGRG
jgi:hypothetical protein